MSAARYAELRRIGVRSVTTAEAAAAWRVSTSAASKTLRDLADAGLTESLRHGVWLLDRDATAEQLVAEVTAPYPAYLSHVSALYFHAIIDQVPAEVHVVSLAEPRRIGTSRGIYRVHRVPADLFGGFVESAGVTVATPEKALFDFAYLSVASGNVHARLPEAEWPRIETSALQEWVARVSSPRLRTLTASLLARRAPSG